MLLWRIKIISSCNKCQFRKCGPHFLPVLAYRGSRLWAPWRRRRPGRCRWPRSSCCSPDTTDPRFASASGPGRPFPAAARLRGGEQTCDRNRVNCDLWRFLFTFSFGSVLCLCRPVGGPVALLPLHAVQNTGKHTKRAGTWATKSQLYTPTVK